MLEAHILAALTPDTRHLILIGDHQQLRPQTAVYELAIKHHLDVSLFERLIMNGVPHVTLAVQHRMRPEISRLIAPIYPKLLDSENVKQYGHIKGVEKDIFFISHNKQESSDKDSKSKSNQFEADIVVALCKYLVQQGYKTSQITILTTYVGQLLTLRNGFRKAQLINGLRISSVDNYQGEENDIIILSLVRSNQVQSIGFLKSPNRVCVALSRAKMGFFCIGNSDLLKDNSPLWNQVLLELRSQEALGTSLALCCQRHPDTKTNVSCAQDFKRVVDGGCNKKCETRLECGHVCPKRY